MSTRQVRERIRRLGRTYPFHVFISFAGQPDTRLAARLRRRLQAVGRRWWERRHLRVYLDVHSAATSGNLPATPHNDLRASAGLVVIASEESKDSRWVTEEVRAWQGLPGRQKPMIAVSG